MIHDNAVQRILWLAKAIKIRFHITPTQGTDSEGRPFVLWQDSIQKVRDWAELELSGEHWVALGAEDSENFNLERFQVVVYCESEEDAEKVRSNWGATR